MSGRPLTKEQLRALASRVLGQVGVGSLAGMLAVAAIRFCDAPEPKKRVRSVSRYQP